MNAEHLDTSQDLSGEPGFSEFGTSAKVSPRSGDLSWLSECGWDARRVGPHKKGRAGTANAATAVGSTASKRVGGTLALLYRIYGSAMFVGRDS
jgi:hypothetical protein